MAAHGLDETERRGRPMHLVHDLAVFGASELRAGRIEGAQADGNIRRDAHLPQLKTPLGRAA